MSTVSVEQNAKIDEAVGNLLAACGFDTSDIADTRWLTSLAKAVERVARDVNDALSDDGGYCLDGRDELASELSRIAQEVAQGPAHLTLTVEMTLDAGHIVDRKSIARDLERELVKVKSGAYSDLACGHIVKVGITESQPAGQTNAGT
jgi:hypothetical protein